MRDSKPPFQFDLRNLISQARHYINDRVSGVSINLPFVSFSVNPEAAEEKVAKEIVIRLANRRVLNAFECCDDCIDKALTSLQEIRSLLVNKQVELSNSTDSALYLIIEFILEAIRQFFTFEERLQKGINLPLKQSHHFRDDDVRARYFSALEMLRSHIYRCLLQMSAIADIKIPKISDHMRYDVAWQIETYVKPAPEAKVTSERKGS